MAKVSRRSFLGSVALSGMFAARAEESRAARPATSSGKLQPQEQEIVWTIARQRRTGGGNQIDFWSKPVCTVPYASQLSTTTGRNVLFSHFASDDLYSDPRLNDADRILGKDRCAWLNEAYRFIPDRFETSSLRLLTNSSNEIECGNTALMALDSRGLNPKEPEWFELLPDFRSRYARLIGHFHVPDRGFHHWKSRPSLGSASSLRFDEFFTRAAFQCDVVVFTSQSLIENDTHLSARASTDMLVSELMMRLSRALSVDEVLAHITRLARPLEQSRQAYMFAVGTAGASAKIGYLELADLLRQREIVFSSFGKPVLRPLLIGLSLDQGSAEAIQRQISGSNLLFLNTRELIEPTEWPEMDWLKLIVLWPFDPGHGPWP